RRAPDPPVFAYAALFRSELLFAGVEPALGEIVGGPVLGTSIRREELDVSEESLALLGRRRSGLGGVPVILDLDDLGPVDPRFPGRYRVSVPLAEVGPGARSREDARAPDLPVTGPHAAHGVGVDR